MNLREKLVTQTVICLMIFAGVKSAAMIDIDAVNKAEDFVTAQFSKNYTMEEVKAAMSGALEQAGNVQKSVMTAVVAANEPDDDNSAESLGEKDEDGVQVVYAVSGGDVLAAGIDKELGMYVKIQSDETVYTYGYLSHISVVPGERARKGDMIGTYDSNIDNKFYYNLQNV